MPFDYLIEEGHELPSETNNFLEKILLKLVNILEEQTISSKDCNFLDNDVVILKGSNVMIISFSRSREYYKRFISEYNLKDFDANEAKITVSKADYFSNDILMKNEQYRKFSNPVSIIFPTSYLKLQENELKQKHEEIASLLLKPTKEDVEKKNRIVKVNPIFNGRNFLKDDNLCFVLMPFSEPYNSIYENIIKPTVEKEGFQCLKSNDIFSTTSVIEDIWTNMNKATLIIAEITENNPNVMYELGICHTIGKDVMMITQKPGEIPFNFRHLRTYTYVNEIAKSEELKKNISSMIQYIKSTQKST